MLLKICLFGCLALIAGADNSIDFHDDASHLAHTRVEHSVSFETSHKRPTDPFETAHKVSYLNPRRDAESDFSDLMQLQETMNLLPTKERPELNPILSALINEDVMKSIEAKRAIEQKELDIIKAEIEEAVQEEEAVLAAAAEQEAAHAQTEAPTVLLTTTAPLEKKFYDDDINVGFVDQTINLDAAGSETSKKSRIEIKKGPNGQDYEYEYVYYYEEDDEDEKTKPAAAATTTNAAEKETRGKSRYTNIERNNAATPADNTLVSGMAKGRSSSVNSAENVEPERLPVNTRFPTRGKNVDVPPTPPLDSLENAAEKKKISVKRPSLELVDSDTFNTDEKNAKSSRNSDADATKPAHALEQEQAAAAAADAANAAVSPTVADSAQEAANNGETVTQAPEEESTTQSMQKAALDLYAILTNENLNMDMTTDADMAGTTVMPDGDEMLTTLAQEEPSSTSTTTTTTTTTTTPAPTTTTSTTTTTTTVASLFGGRRAGLAAAGRNRYKSKGATTTTTTEAPAPAEPKSKNRFSRPSSLGGRGRIAPKTTAAPEVAAEEQEVIEKKDVKPVSSGFGRGRPRNRFNLRGSTSSTEKPAESGEEAPHDDSVSTTARSLRARPTLNLRGRSRITTTKAPASAESAPNGEGEAAPAAAEEKSAAPAARPSRFNINRPGSNRLLPRTKLGRTTEAPAAAAADADSAVEGTHNNDIKESGEENAVAPAEKSETEAHPVSHVAGGLNRLKSRPRLNTIQKTESPKPKPTPIAPRKVNPLLAKRRLQLGSTTTEAPAAESEHADSAEEAEAKEDSGAAAAAAHDTAAADSSEEDATEAIETTTKAQARGLGLLGQRRRLPLRKPGTIL